VQVNPLALSYPVVVSSDPSSRIVGVEMRPETIGNCHSPTRASIVLAMSIGGSLGTVLFSRVT
jgi:hypothetical protein